MEPIGKSEMRKYYLQRLKFTNLANGYFRTNCIFSKTANSHKMNNLMAFASETTGPIRHHAFALLNS